jgi:hypothetical protein
MLTVVSLSLSLSGVGNKQTRKQTNQKLKRKKEEKWDGEKRQDKILRDIREAHLL